MKSIKLLGLMFITAFITTASFGQKMSNEKTVAVGGAPMYPSKNIIEIDLMELSSRALPPTSRAIFQKSSIQIKIGFVIGLSTISNMQSRSFVCTGQAKPVSALH